MLCEPAVDAFAFRREARDFELGERSHHVAGEESARADELVRGGGKELEQRMRGDLTFRQGDAERLEYIAWRRQRRRAEPEQSVRTCRERRRDLAGNGEDLSSLLDREVRRDQRATPLARFDDDRRRAETGGDPVARRASPGPRP